jgi:hypothetical protein
MTATTKLLQMGAAGAAGEATYIEDVFSTYLYTGTGATQSINNGVDLAGEGGLVWIKERTSVAGSIGHQLTDTARGYEYQLRSDSSNAQTNEYNRLTSFNADGFTLGNSSYVNINTGSWVSWTFRKAEKFFDVVTYTGTGSARTVSHNLGSVPGCIIVRDLSAGDWIVYHRSLGNTDYVRLNTTGATASASTLWNNTTPTSTNFTVGTSNAVNSNGASFVAYLFAHDAGGFGDDGDQSVIACGSYVGAGSSTAVDVNLGWEPQWVLRKASSAAGYNWAIIDNMRGMPVSGSGPNLYPNLSNAESNGTVAAPKATGFNGYGDSGVTYIYIAIRRGPMKTPESGTSIFTPVARSGTGTTATVSNGITTDLIISMTRNTTGISSGVWDRLRGFSKYLETTGTASESTSADSVTAMNNTSYVLGGDSGTDRINRSGYTYANWTFSRAPGFFDVVCYTGTGSSGATFNHNLGVAPELMIVKIRNQIGAAWAVYHASLGNTKVIRLNTTAAATTSSAYWNNTSPTSTVFSVGNDGDVNNSGDTYVAYLFATCPGVSKVGSYTGTGTTLQVNCGFTAGSRFVLIKRTDSTGNWYVWDSARGIVAGNDPYLLLNSTAAEVTNTDYVDTYSAGFEISSTAPAAINENGGTFIYLAIA